MSNFFKAVGTIAALAMSNGTTFYLGYEVASRECKECKLDFVTSIKKPEI